MDQEGELVAELWGKKDEERFFLESLKNYAAPEQLFYSTAEGKYLAYWPKGYKGPKTTLQSRNALIGSFTEKWVANLIKNIVDSKNYFVVQGAICKKIGLTSASSADVIISKSGTTSNANNILLIIEVKMSIVWNGSISTKIKLFTQVKNASGNPGLLRSIQC